MNQSVCPCSRVCFEYTSTWPYAGTINFEPGIHRVPLATCWGAREDGREETNRKSRARCTVHHSAAVYQWSVAYGSAGITCSNDLRAAAPHRLALLVLPFHLTTFERPCAVPPPRLEASLLGSRLLLLVADHTLHDLLLLDQERTDDTLPNAKPTPDPPKHTSATVSGN